MAQRRGCKTKDIDAKEVTQTLNNMKRVVLIDAIVSL
jgi:hypothetical protein